MSEEREPFMEDPDLGHAHICPSCGAWFHYDLRCKYARDEDCPDCAGEPHSFSTQAPPPSQEERLAAVRDILHAMNMINYIRSQMQDVGGLVIVETSKVTKH